MSRLEEVSERTEGGLVFTGSSFTATLDFGLIHSGHGPRMRRDVI